MTKRNLNDLALFGGIPAFAKPLHVGCPNTVGAERFFDRVKDIFQSRRFTNNGTCVRTFESFLESDLGVKHCIVTCNGTIALQVLIQALDLQGEVIVPSFTFIATAHALQWQRCKPVFCDIDPNTHNLNPAAVESLITPRTSAILGVHVWGRPCAVDALTKIARRHNLKLILDAAHAFACSHNGRMIGNFGNAEVFSFHATKFFHTFEGGAITTNDSDLAKKIRLMINFGFSGYDDVVCLGTNGKMNELCAAMGLIGLESLPFQLISINREHYLTYKELLKPLPGIKLIEYDESERCNFQYVVVEVEASDAGMGRNRLLEILHAENVLARRYFYPGCHRMEPYRSQYPSIGSRLTNTENLADRVLILPTGTSITTENIQTICSIIRCAIENQ